MANIHCYQTQYGIGAGGSHLLFSRATHFLSVIAILQKFAMIFLKWFLVAFCDVLGRRSKSVSGPESRMLITSSAHWEHRVHTSLKHYSKNRGTRTKQTPTPKHILMIPRTLIRYQSSNPEFPNPNPSASDSLQLLTVRSLLSCFSLSLSGVNQTNARLQTYSNLNPEIIR